MPDRLTELKQQRALVAGHLQWLDREIAALEPAPGKPVPVSAPPPPAAVAPVASPAPTADPIFAALQDEERRRGEVSKSGCWIVFAGVLVVIVGAVTAIILIRYR